DGAHRLLLRDPDLGTAIRIAEAVNEELGSDVARVEDPGAVALDLSGNQDGDGEFAALARIQEVRLTVERTPRVVVDGRDGTVVTGGDVVVSPGVVSHGEITLTIGAVAADTTTMSGGIHVP